MRNKEIDEAIDDIADSLLEVKFIDLKEYRKIHSKYTFAASNSGVMTSKQFQKIRGKLNLSQSALGTALGVSTSTIHKWEQGSSAINQTAAVLMRILDRQGLACLKP